MFRLMEQLSITSRARSMVFCIFSAWLVVGCGGGGGGGSGSGVSNGSGSGSTTVNHSDQPLRISSSNAVDVIDLPFSEGASTLQLADVFISDIIALRQDGRSSIVAACSGSGSVYVSYIDTDGSGTLSTGDTLREDYSACYDSVDRTTTNGSVSVALSQFSAGLNGAVSIFGTLQTPTRITVHDNSGSRPDLFFDARFIFRYQLTSGAENLFVDAGASDFLQIGFSNDTEHFTNFHLKKLFNFGRWDYLYSMDIDIRSDVLNGAYSCRSVNVFGGTEGYPPSVGVFRCTGSGNSAAQLVSTNSTVSVDAQGAGQYQNVGPYGFEWTYFANYLQSHPIQGIYSLPTLVPSANSSLSTVAVTYDRHSGLLYASVPSTSTNFPRSLVAIDPSTGSIVRSLALNNEPGTVAVSADGTALYVGYQDAGIVQKVLLPQMSLDAVFALGVGPQGARYAGQIAVSPADPQRIAVATSTHGTNGNSYFNFQDLLLIDHGVVAANTSERTSKRLAFSSDGSQLFGVDTGLFGFTMFAIDSSGITALPTAAAAMGPGQITVFNNKVYQASGNIFDPQQNYSAGVFTNLNGDRLLATSIAIDEGAQRVYVFDTWSHAIYVYDANSFVPIGGYATPSDNIYFMAVASNGDLILVADSATFTIPKRQLTNISFTPCFGYLFEGVSAPFANTKTSCLFNDAVYDTRTARIFASIPSRVGSQGNSVAVINPETGTIEKLIPVGSEPNKMNISSDGSVLYVGLDGSGQVAEISPSTQSVRRKFDLPLDIQGPVRAADLRVSPQDANTIVLILRGRGIMGSTSTSVAAMTNGVALPQYLYNLSTYQSTITFADNGSHAYISSANNFYTLGIDTTGVELVSDRSVQVPFGTDGYYLNGQLYTERGYVIDPETLTQTLHFHTENFNGYTGPFTIDPTSQSLYSAPPSFDLIINSYNITSGAAIGTMELIDPAGDNAGVLRLLNLDSVRLGVVTSNSVYVIDKANVR